MDSDLKFTGCMLVIIVFLLIGGIFFIIIKDYVIGNKQLIDFNQNFNVAYIMGDSNRFERVRIKAWKDWENSDAVQIILENGTPIYTHLHNVKLTKED